MNRLDDINSPTLSNTVLERLFTRKIFTVQQFLEKDAESISSVTGLPLKDVVTLRQSLITTYAAFVKKGVDEYLDLSTNSSILLTGIKCLDDLMSEELKTGSIIELCGVVGSGKTQLCLAICINNCLAERNIVHYIDASLGNFVADRIANMLENRKLSKEIVKYVMKSIKMTKINSMLELISTLYYLKTSLGNQETCCRIIIIDSLAAVYLPLLNKADNDGIYLVNHVASLMRFISKQFHLIFLVVNSATKFFDPEATFENADDAPVEPNRLYKDLRPLLGRYWLHVPCTRLLIHPVTEKSLDEKRRIITVLKSSRIPIFSSCNVTISEGGVVSS